MKQYLGELMPVIVEALLDGTTVIKREVAVATLGQVVQSAGCFQTTEQAVVVHQPSKSHIQILRRDFVLFVEPNVV
ncbi:serine/threonine-protein kinase TOR-like [Magnolia sinica]|uniref:serine/threonine-protein kinase TOR-like n=1 Tax=Magnolia sinica TaxID=86752 RepID=UPI002658485E|nr:serine/threonine-protein kinase TOR-like [Magnolia sinica]